LWEVFKISSDIFKISSDVFDIPREEIGAMSDVFCLEIGRFRSFMADIYKNGRNSCEKCKFMHFSKPAKIAYFQTKDIVVQKVALNGRIGNVNNT